MWQRTSRFGDDGALPRYGYGAALWQSLNPTYDPLHPALAFLGLPKRVNGGQDDRLNVRVSRQ
ncbi:Uncharacterised protein [Vibrio cholerae]|uniref:Uncharacterized protein n=1 Tax=Vibrio cholerae TaxID=666 RepID=A0A655QHX9_VIBCL|nr:Uncharacterised protein [Vibrio cholerae]CSC06409.1 Uncharacterised protein [Vibrio cholerae]CSI22303.1 Uncharacterised protein [Vibrio cholerae]